MPCAVPAQQRQEQSPNANGGRITTLVLNAGSLCHSLTGFLRQEKCDSRRMNTAGHAGAIQCCELE